MPSHEVHRKLHVRYSWVVLIPGIPVFILSGWYMSMFVVLGYILERWWNFDLDHKNFTKAEVEIRAIPIVGPYIIGHTSAYAQLIAYLPPVFGFPRGHNSWWSHFPPMGALLLLYWAWWPVMLLLGFLSDYLSEVWLIEWVFYYYHLDGLSVEFWGLYHGLHAAGWVHSIADLFFNDRNLPINDRFWWFRQFRRR